MIAIRQSRTSLRASALAIVLLAASWIALGPSSAAASRRVDFDLRCYIVGKHPNVTVTGSGFAPGANLVLQLQKWIKGDRQVVQAFPVTADAMGGLSLSFPNPGEDRTFTVAEVSEPDVPLATKDLWATKFEAGYFDGMSRKGPTRVKNGMVIFGRGFAGAQQGAPGSGETDKLYLHRIAPGGSVKTELLSTLRTCGFGGTNRVSGRPLFKGITKVKAGNWKFQYDTSAKYKSGTKEKIVVPLKVSKKGIVTPGEQTKTGKI